VAADATAEKENSRSEPRQGVVAAAIINCWWLPFGREIFARCRAREGARGFTFHLANYCHLP
jgi:hypothetical protein